MKFCKKQQEQPARESMARENITSLWGGLFCGSGGGGGGRNGLFLPGF